MINAPATSVEFLVTTLSDWFGTYGIPNQWPGTCTVEALGGTLKAAKKRKVVAYDSELLLQGAHDHVDIVLLQE